MQICWSYTNIQMHRNNNNTYFNVSFFKRKSNGIIGTIFPKTQAGKTFVIGNPIHNPTGTAPRSSITGMAEIIANIARSGRPKVRK